ncbi:MAG: CPBP family intramembrane metalloprotease [Tepidisphaeraceae bacterium]
MAGAWAMGVFRRGSVRGPVRVIERRFVPALWLIAALMVLTTLLASMLAGSLFFAMRRTTELSARDLAIVSTIARVVPIVVALGVHVQLRTGLLRAIGLGVDRLGKGWAGLLGLLVAVPWVYFVMSVAQIVYAAFGHASKSEHEMLTLMRQTHDSLVLVLTIVNAVLIAPVAEELLFRGHVQTALRTTTGRPWVAILATSALFAVIHPWWSIPGILVLAICLGYLYERTASLWACIALHVGFNLLSTVVALTFAG